MPALSHGRVLPAVSAANPVKSHLPEHSWEVMKSKLSCCVQIISAFRWSDSYTVPIRQAMVFCTSCAKLNLIFLPLISDEHEDLH